MVRSKLMVGQSVRSFRRASGRAGVKRWIVAKLQDDYEDDRGTVTAYKRGVSGECKERAEGEMGHRQQCRREMGCFEFRMCDAVGVDRV